MYSCSFFLIYEGSRDTSLGWSSNSPLKSKSGDIPNPNILGSAESLIERVSIWYDNGIRLLIDAFIFFYIVWLFQVTTIFVHV